MIGEEPPKTSDPEVAAKRAIDEAVATLRSLAEGVQARPPARPTTDAPGPSARHEAAAFDDAFQPGASLRARLQEGFHRLGLVLALTLLAVNGVMLLAFFNPSEAPVDIRRALLLLLATAVVYLLSRSLGWVALGFVEEPAPGDPLASSTLVGEAAAPPRPRAKRIGGWLWLPILTVALLIILGIERAPRFPSALAAALQNPSPQGIFLAAAAALGLVFTAAWAYELYLMARRRARARRVYVALSLASLAVTAAVSLISVAAFQMPADGLLLSAVEALGHVIWIPFMLRSRRARETFAT